MDRPNFIFILTDDQAYGLMGCTGNEVVRTPNLDRLASDGVLFTNAHVTSAICTPSRASILLSEFERKHHINFNSGTSMNLEAWESTYPMVMRSNGYYTGWIGKNHVPVGEGGYSSGVMDQSFDYWYAGHGHLSFYPKTRHDIFKNASEDTQVEVLAEGVQDFLTNDQKLDGAKRFLDQRPTEQPFMLSVCLNLPHGAGTRSMEMKDTDDEIYKTLYRDQTIAMPDQYIAKDEIVTPKLPSDLLKVEDRQTIYDYVNTPETNREIMIRELQAMTGIDRMVGELMEKLKEENLLKNTVIIFSSDHGLYKGQHGLGGKALCYEQTTHVPLIIYDPRAKNTGVRSDELVQSIDIAPTILDMAGFQLPDSYQGKSLVRLLNQEVPRVREYLYTENLWSTHFGNPRCEAVQNKSWKYIRYYKNENFSATKKVAVAKKLGLNVNSILYKRHDLDMIVYHDYIESSLSGEIPVYEELYQLEDDPQESNNLATQSDYTDKLDEMRDIWSLEIKKARGTGNARVLRYTVESEEKNGKTIQPK